jgi:CDP-paratose 2-epimerase
MKTARSSVSRILSASAASWVRIGVTVVTQIALVALYLQAADDIKKIRGQAFNIGGGIENSSSLLELFSFLEKELDIKMTYTQLPPRESDQRVFVADITKIQKMIGWKPIVTKAEGIGKMIDWIAN